MATNYSDFDTVCYDLQYNVMKLIKKAVQTSATMSDLQSQITNINNKVDNWEDVNGDIFGLVSDVMDIQQDMASTLETLASLVALNTQSINALDARVTALGG